MWTRLGCVAPPGPWPGHVPADTSRNRADPLDRCGPAPSCSGLTHRRHPLSLRTSGILCGLRALGGVSWLGQPSGASPTCGGTKLSFSRLRRRLLGDRRGVGPSRRAAFEAAWVPASTSVFRRIPERRSVGGGVEMWTAAPSPRSSAACCPRATVVGRGRAGVGPRIRPRPARQPPRCPRRAQRFSTRCPQKLSTGGPRKSRRRVLRSHG